ncbi:Uncharacterised protein [Neisseria gonorrhoeae]|uniref:Uncharacterized protein n=1 Tax=Neisseria gonorrhoeae TaxID=485 RepID=A0A378VY51_NEIGO|nr:Uncharacterised protein [Neisseria gonorrhoeae]
MVDGCALGSVCIIGFLCRFPLIGGRSNRLPQFRVNFLNFTTKCTGQQSAGLSDGIAHPHVLNDRLHHCPPIAAL